MKSNRHYRYAIEVNGNAEQFSARYEAATKRADVIAKSWPSACRVIVRDTWNARPAYVALDIVTGASVAELSEHIMRARFTANWAKHEYLWDMRAIAEVTADESALAADIEAHEAEADSWAIQSEDLKETAMFRITATFHDGDLKSAVFHIRAANVALALHDAMRALANMGFDGDTYSLAHSNKLKA